MVTVFLVALVVAGFSMLAVLPLLMRWTVMDVPNHRSSHTTPVPRGGGLALLCGLMAAGLVALWRADDFAWAVVAASLLLAAVGFWDDLTTLPGSLRLVAQGSVALGFLWWVVVAGDKDPRSWVGLGLAAVVFVGYVNAFNFMDGVNGMSAVNAGVIMGWYSWVALASDLPAAGAVALATAGAVTGFLPWNAPRARVFLGDVGSYALGAAIVALACLLWSEGVAAPLLAAPLLVYCVDTGWAVLKRVRGRRPLFEAHREHVYQRLVDQGWTHTQAVMPTVVAAAAACACAGLPWVWLMVAWMAIAAIYIAIPTAHAHRRREVRV